jgi:hypothetical protein
MKNNKDFIYEYSEINLFQTKASILSGEYAGIDVEFASSGVMNGIGKPIFNFEYQIYRAPINFIINDDFENYLSKLLIAIIDHRNKDNNSLEKLHKAAALTNTKSLVPYHSAIKKLSYVESKILINISFKDYVKSLYNKFLLDVYIKWEKHYG